MATSDPARADWWLLPGTLCTGAVFDAMLDALDVPMRRRQMIPLDQPSIAEYGRVLDRVPDTAVVCGFSLGAIVAAHHADRMAAQRLFLFGLNPLADDPAKSQARHDLARDVRQMGGSSALIARNPVFHGAEADRTRDTVLRMADDAAPLIDVHTQLALSRPGALPALAKARLPVVVLTGALDTDAPPMLGRQAANAAPDGRFEILEDAGHFAILENPELCARRLIQQMDA